MKRLAEYRKGIVGALTAVTSILELGTPYLHGSGLRYALAATVMVGAVLNVLVPNADRKPAGVLIRTQPGTNATTNTTNTAGQVGSNVTYGSRPDVNVRYDRDMPQP